MSGSSDDFVDETFLLNQDPDTVPVDDVTGDEASVSQAPQRSLVEAFLNGFFQEANIKWMLVVGAAIVFGSSLMLVTKNWPQWTPQLKYLTILAYTGLIFFLAEVSRKRLHLKATYRVLHCLTLLLMPVSFLSLAWLSSGTAVQSSLGWLRYLGLLIPAVGLLWFASKTVIDHWLRGRQTTFLASFIILCVAGALPPIDGLWAALMFASVGWLVMSVGVVKVNRHTFWLAEDQQLPRILGFLPIIMLGLQWVILVAVKAGDVLSAEWMGWMLVMVSATILMTTRTFAEVYRQRTGDLVRPLPWIIAVPLLVGVLMTVMGGLLSLSGMLQSEFSLLGISAGGGNGLAAVAAAIVATFLFLAVARDTKHSCFVWASLITITIAYQCSPTLFSDLVRMLQSATAQAINHQRIPVSLYGVTYLPLLGVLLAVHRWSVVRKQIAMSQPIKHFVTSVGLGLTAFALVQMGQGTFVPAFFVSGAYGLAWCVAGVVFQDRRYGLLGIVSAVLAAGTCTFAIIEMGYLDVSPHWSAVVLAGVATLLSTTRVPDRLLMRIPVSGSHRWLVRADGEPRNVCHSMGTALALLVTLHWIVMASMTLGDTMTEFSLFELGILVMAFVVGNIRSPRYLTGASLWGLLGLALLQAAIGSAASTRDLVIYATYIMGAISLIVFAVIKRSQRCERGSFSSRRSELGIRFAIGPLREAGEDRLSLVESTSGASETLTDTRSRVSDAFLIPLFDLSVGCMAILLALTHLPSLVLQHVTHWIAVPTPWLGLGWSTWFVLVWLLIFTWRARHQVAGAVAMVWLPLIVTAGAIGLGLTVDFSLAMTLWAVTTGGVVLAIDWGTRRGRAMQTILMMQVGQAWLVVLLLLSCSSFEILVRLVAAIAILVLFWVGRQELRPAMRCGLAMLVCLNSLFVAALWGGCQGWLLPGLLESFPLRAIAPLMLVSSLSVLFFDAPPRSFACRLSGRWAWGLRLGMVLMACLSWCCDRLGTVDQCLVVFGLAVMVIAEILQAIRHQRQGRVWSAMVVGGGIVGFLYLQGVISFGIGISQFVMLVLSVLALSLAVLAERQQRTRVLCQPLRIVGHCLPMVVSCLAIVREFSGMGASSTLLNSLSLMISAGIYFHQAAVLKKKVFCLPAGMIVNAGLFLLWRVLSWDSPELYLVPVGVSVLGLVELMKKDLPQPSHTPLRYIGSLMILCSPLFEVIGGSWIHLLVLMVLSVLVILAAIGLRLRSLMYAGTAFLMVDLVAMVWRSTIHNVNLLWICGVALGIGVIALAAFCENHRDKLLSKIRMVSAELATWS